MRAARDVQVFVDCTYARRFAAFNTGFLDTRPDTGVYLDALRGDDLDAACVLIEEGDGADAAARAGRWMARQPEAFSVCRGDEGIAGCIALLTLDGADWDAADVHADPVLAAPRRYVRDYGPEPTQVLRWFVQRGALHRPGPMQDLVQDKCLRAWPQQEERGLRWMIIPHTRAEACRPHFTGILFALAPDYAAEFNGLRFEPWVRDWRRTPFWAWMRGAFEQEMQAELAAWPAPATPAPVDLADTLRRALRDFASDARLSRSPLVVALACPDLGAMRDSIRAEVAALSGELRGEPLRKALEVTFMSGCPSQELAAEQLDVPFGTYGHRLRAAEALLVERVRLQAGCS